jgi:hypothetical protein
MRLSACRVADSVHARCLVEGVRANVASLQLHANQLTRQASRNGTRRRDVLLQNSWASFCAPGVSSASARPPLLR